MYFKIIIFMLTTWLYSLSANAQTSLAASTPKPKDEITFLPIPKLERILFIESDFKKYKIEYQKEYNSIRIDTLKKQQKDSYIKHTFLLAEILASENKKDTVVSLIERLYEIGGLDNYYASIAGSATFYSLKNNTKWQFLSKHAYEMLSVQAKGFRNPDLRITLLLLEAADQSNMFFYYKDTAMQKRTTARLLDTVDKLFQTYGYPKASEVGKDVADAPALILVHAPLKTQLKYRNMIEKEGLAGNIPDGTAGILIDKIMVAQEGKQSYGSQYKVSRKADQEREIFFYPIEDEPGLEKRRKAMGFNVSYEAYKSMVHNQFKR